MSTSAVTETCFTSTFVDRAACIFLRPDPRYTWDNIVTGVIVRSEDGSKRTFSAAAGNTFRGFVRINKKRPGAQKCFRQYFLDEKENLIEQLSRLETREELHQLENRIRTAIRARIDNVVLKEAEDESYNKFRKPVDLYIMNLVAMASELDARRAVLTPFLFMPLDSLILKHEKLFSKAELRVRGLSRRSTYSQVRTESTYLALQSILDQLACQEGKRLGKPFSPIYFDFVWNNRYENWGGNLFETNP